MRKVDYLSNPFSKENLRLISRQGADDAESNPNFDPNLIPQWIDFQPQQ